MGYFDALMSSWFKTLPDGRKLFYPRGAWGRGYIIASEQDYKRLRQQIKVYLIVMVVLMIGASVAPGYLWILGLGVLLLGFYYLVFAPYCVRGLQPSDEKLSLQDSYTNEARVQFEAPVVNGDRLDRGCWVWYRHARFRPCQPARCGRHHRHFRIQRGRLYVDAAAAAREPL